VSHGFGSGLASSFLFDGTRDYSALLSLPTALDVWAALGGFSTLRRRAEQTLRQAADWLCRAWGTDTLAAVGQVHGGCMALVRLPGGHENMTSDHAKAIQDRLYG
jgi:hypothetical protein